MPQGCPLKNKTQIKALIKHGNWNVSVVITAAKGNKKAQYTFIHRALDHTLILLSYKLFVRMDSSEYKLRKRWSRASLPSYPNSMKAKNIPRSNRVKHLAIDKFKEALNFNAFLDAKDGPITDNLEKFNAREKRQRYNEDKRKISSKKKPYKKYRRFHRKTPK